MADSSMNTIGWDQGQWTHPPVNVHPEGTDLCVEAVEGSDVWRVTSYGFVHDTEHALVVPMANPGAVEVRFLAEFEEQFDQAGIFLTGADDLWVKAGVEFADGTPQLGAVVTNPHSDWSVAAVPDWIGREVTVRASRSGDAVTIRARVEGEDFRLVRVVPIPSDVDLAAGPMVCAPTRAGLVVRFTGWWQGAADSSLHP
ncbi:DUF1349 domain-containing protein [Luteococcus sp. H138]|uniref:DUF1349 domain-containing protein n=1 Tax=unclassified Luteococcus TaxID=2639923 RepID=UPI00313CC47E